MTSSEIYSIIDSKILDILREEKITKFYPPQEEALSYSLFGKNVLLAIPTASGKTLVAEITIVQSFLKMKKKNINKKILYLCPLKALASEKYYDLNKRWGKLGIRIGYSVGDLDRINVNVFKNDIIIMTNEKADSLLRSKPNLIKDLDYVIIDEIHLINDETRGITLEIIITRILDENPKVKVIGLSATINNASELSNWLNAQLIESEWRPVSLREGYYSKNEVLFSNGDVRHLKSKSVDPIYNLVSDILDEDGQCLIFTSTRKNSQTQAEKLAKQLTDRHNPEELKKFMKVSLDFKKLLNQNETSSGSKKMELTLKSGVAFHNAGLPQNQRHFIEDRFKNRLIKVLTATPTLAAGVNTPARMVIIKSPYRFDGKLGRSNKIPILEYKQMAGRAGRPGFDPYGESILISQNSDKAQELAEYYIDGEPEPILSKLRNPDLLQSHILGFIAMKGESNETELIDFLSKTFLSFQIRIGTNFNEKKKKISQNFKSKKIRSEIQKNRQIRDGRINRKGARGNEPLGIFSHNEGFMSASELYDNNKKSKKEKINSNSNLMTNENLRLILRNIVQDMLEFLVSNKFIIKLPESNKKKEIKYSTTKIGTAVYQMYLKPNIAADLVRRLNLVDSVLKNSDSNYKINEITILYMIALSQELLGGYYRKSEYNLIKAQVLRYKENLEIFTFENDEDENYSIFDDMNALKQTFILTEWIREVPESIISDTFGIGIGDLHRYVETARWLSRGIYLFSKLLKNDKLIKLNEKLSSRIRYGVKNELIKFVNLKGIGRVRARVLYKNGILSIKQLFETPNIELENLSNLISHNLVKSVKSQIKSGKIKEKHSKINILDKDFKEPFDDLVESVTDKGSSSRPKEKPMKTKIKQYYLI